MIIANQQQVTPAVLEAIARAPDPRFREIMSALVRHLHDFAREVKLTEPWVPLIANVSAAPVRDAEEIKRLLVEQVTGLVRWRECVLAMKEQGVYELIELGAGKVLTGLTKRVDKELTGQAIGTPAEIEAFLKTL